MACFPSSKAWRLAIWLVAAGALSPTSFAAVFKCVGADGKTVYSDQVCPGAPAAGATKPMQPPDARRGADSNDARTRAECFQMRDRIAELLEKGTGSLPEADFRALNKRFEAQCREVARQEMEKQDAKDATSQAPLRKAQDASRCVVMRKELDQLRMEQRALERQATPITAAQKQQFLQFEASVSRDCG